MKPVIDSRFLPSQVQVSNAIRKFWVDMNRLIRVYITNTLFNIEGADTNEAVNENLRKVSEERRSILVQYYGEDIANQIQADFTKYIFQIEQLINAYADRNEAAINKYRNNLYSMADTLAQNYAVINNYLDRTAIQALIYALINSVENQVVSIMNGDYVRDLEQYEAFMDDAYRLADEFTYGILRQFYGSD